MLQITPSMNEVSLQSTLIQTRHFLPLELLSARLERFVPLKPLALLLCPRESLIEDMRHAVNGTSSFVPDMPYLFFCTVLLMPWPLANSWKYNLKRYWRAFFYISANVLSVEKWHNGKNSFHTQFQMLFTGSKMHLVNLLKSHESIVYTFEYQNRQKLKKNLAASILLLYET